jgi:predicted nuclease with TOPRIM domain
MESLTELKERYDEITYILDEKECTQAHKMDLVKELHDCEAAFTKFSNQIEQLKSLIDAT